MHRCLAVSACLLTVAAAAGEASLREMAAKRKFLVGAAVAIGPLVNETEYQDTLKREFNICVPENAFKMAGLRPARDKFDFSQADKLAEFAAANNIKLRGHTLVWHQSVPKWLSDGKFSRDEALQIMKEHITTVLQHFKGKVYAWDVVNEAIHDKKPYAIRDDSFWGKTIGADYVEKAFEFARAADPNIILYYNEYGAEGMGGKSDAVYELVKKLREKKLVDGVGWQCHVPCGWKPGDAHAQNAERLGKLGVELAITELDFAIKQPTTPEKLQAQADSYRDTLKFCLSQPAFKALLTWGFTDKHSWIPGFSKGKNGDALVFDAQYKPKPAYGAMIEALKQ
jgi:endo-1,4-beta-xylanase